ncbi:C40 family peptidase, partial [Timonella senegalensis]|uniref:C40 family peptidase n=1 Tax=Timonella senegalensis TaxID=1465825 RepID=UPI003A5C7F03
LTSISIVAPDDAQNTENVAFESTSGGAKRTFKNSISRKFGAIAIATSVAAAGLVAFPAAAQASTNTESISTPVPTETPTTEVTTDPTVDPSAPAEGSTGSTTPPPAAEAAPVAPAPVKKVYASMSLKASKKSWTTGSSTAKMTATVKVNGKAAAGKVHFHSGSKHLKTVTLKSGKASYTLSKKLSTKKHKITAIYYPNSASAKVAKKTTSKPVYVTVKKLSESQRIVKEAKKHVGTPYRWGGTTPKGFDCSGFTSYVYKKAGVAKLPRSSSAQRNVGTKVSRSKAKAGDLIWSPGHVAIYLGNGKMIDAPRPGKTIQVRHIWQANPTFIRL